MGSEMRDILLVGLWFETDRDKGDGQNLPN